MTSPVDLSPAQDNLCIGERLKGKTLLLPKCWRTERFRKTKVLQDRPSMTLVASLARGTPIALLTKGTVREARGDLQQIKNSLLTAYWMFIRPTTCSSRDQLRLPLD